MSWKEFFEWLMNLIVKPKPPTPTPDPGPIVTNQVDLLLKLHNDHRKKIGLPLLKANAALMNAARKHSDWMFKNKTLSHYGPNNQSPGNRIKDEGYNYRTYGENIANGYPTPEKVFQGWLNSYGHRANIENGKFLDVGIGISGNYWTVVFAATYLSNPFSRGVAYLPQGLQYEDK